VWIAAEDDVDKASNAVVHLIDAGRLDEAEEAAHRLLHDYPEVHDGHERLGMVYEARGDMPRAIEMYQRALDFTLEHDGYDEEARDWYREKLTDLHARLSA
jgi:tetratricopeptide (TPR) repeat protein